jgi:hypothetical protein
MLPSMFRSIRVVRTRSLGHFRMEINPLSPISRPFRTRTHLSRPENEHFTTENCPSLASSTTKSRPFRSFRTGNARSESAILQQLSTIQSKMSFIETKVATIETKMTVIETRFEERFNSKRLEKEMTKKLIGLLFMVFLTVTTLFWSILTRLGRGCGNLRDFVESSRSDLAPKDKK